jgi:hypothetical protein
MARAKRMRCSGSGAATKLDDLGPAEHHDQQPSRHQRPGNMQQCNRATRDHHCHRRDYIGKSDAELQVARSDECSGIIMGISEGHSEGHHEVVIIGVEPGDGDLESGSDGEADTIVNREFAEDQAGCEE